MNGRKLPWGVVSEGGPSVQKEGFQGLLFGEEGLGEVLSRCRRGPAGVGRPPAPFLHSSSPFPSPHIKAPGRSEAPSRPCLPPRPLSTSMLSSPNPHGPATQPPARRLPSLSPCRGREPGAGAAAGEEVSAGLGVRGCGGAGGGRAPWFGTDGLTENRLPPPVLDIKSLLSIRSKTGSSAQLAAAWGVLVRSESCNIQTTNICYT